MAKTGCAACHTAPTKNHKAGEQCDQCHQPGTKFVFVHSSAGDCAKCHKAPGGKHSTDPNCKGCHTPATWAFSHPRRGLGEHNYKSFAVREVPSSELRQA